MNDDDDDDKVPMMTMKMMMTMAPKMMMMTTKITKGTGGWEVVVGPSAPGVVVGAGPCLIIFHDLILISFDKWASSLGWRQRPIPPSVPDMSTSLISYHRRIFCQSIDTTHDEIQSQNNKFT